MAAVAVLALFVASGISAAPAQTPARAGWTFLYYVSADTTLESEMLNVLRSVAAAGAPANVKVVALVDRSSGNNGSADGDLGSIPAFTDAKLVEIVGGDFKVLVEPGEVDMGRGETWAWFLTQGMTLFPAEHYVAVVPGEATGVLGTAWDYGGNLSALSMTELAAGMRAALEATKETSFELVGFNGPFTAHLDLAAKLAPYANYMLASEETIAAGQWDEAALLRAAEQPRATGRDLGRAVVDRMKVTTGGEQRWAASTIDLNQMGQVTQALSSFAQAVIDAAGATIAPLTHAQAASLHFGETPTDDDVSLYDIGDLIAHLDGVPPQVETAANAFWEAQRRAVVTVATGSASTAAHGLALYFPRNGDGYFQTYAQEAASHEWVLVLNAVTGGAEVLPVDAAPEVSAFMLDIRPDGVVATANVANPSGVALKYATQYDGLLQPDGSVQYLAVTPASLVFTQPATVSGQWNFQYAAITDGVSALASTIFLYPTSGALYANVPMVYQAANGAQEQVGLVFVIDGSTGAIDGPQVYLASGAQLMPAPGSRLTPLVLVVNPGGTPSFEKLSEASLDFSAPVGVAATRAPTGATFVVAINVVDVQNGNGAGSGTGVVP